VPDGKAPDAAGPRDDPGGAAQGKGPARPGRRPREGYRGETDVATTPPALPPPACTYAIDLETAWGLAGVQNPTIAIAQEAVRESLSLQLQARALLLPTLNAGTNYHSHTGNLQASPGFIRQVDSQDLYVGAGARTLAAETVAVPGIRLFAHLGDAVYEPLAARRRVAVRHFEEAATENAVLLEVAVRYLDLVGAEALLEAVRQSEAELGEVVKLTAVQASAGQGRAGDAERALSQALLLHTEEQRAEEEVAVASARLATLLSLDPAVRLRTVGGPVPLIRLVGPADCLEQLVQVAVLNRPELRAKEAAIAVREARLRQEQVRPLLPLLSVGYSAGSFGGGSNLVDTRFGHFGARTDFDAFAVWTLQNFGFGNLALQRERAALVREAQGERLATLDEVRREVADAYAFSAARGRQVDVAQREMRAAQDGLRRDMLRARNLEGRPIELLDSVNLLAEARVGFIRAAIGYDQAQFRLFVALGQPPTQAHSDAPPAGRR
jgi:outer membrane protein TolC